MATIKAIVHPKQMKADKSWNVKIHIYHNRQAVDNPTAFYVVKSQLNKSFKIKDQYLLDSVNDIIKGYRKTIERLGRDIEKFTARELADYLEKQDSRKLDSGKIDFIAFGEKFAGKLDKKRYADKFYTVLNSLKDFTGKNKIYTEDITSIFLRNYELYLRSKRVIQRPAKEGHLIDYIKNPVKDTTVKTYMTEIRTLFNACKAENNDEDRNVIAIPQNPFKKYRMPEAGKVEKRNLPVQSIANIRDWPEHDNLSGNKRRPGNNCANLGRDVFMLIFYLMGINIVDLFNVVNVQDGRLLYVRAKTEKNRKQKTPFSVRIPDEAKPLFQKYADPSGKRVFRFYKDYGTEQSFNRAVNKGLAVIAGQLGLPNLTTYYARHSVANIGVNDCGFSMADADVVLDHVDNSHKMTRFYVENNTKVIDSFQAAVLDLLASVKPVDG